MRTVTIICDICGKEMPQRGWEDAPRCFAVKTHCSSQNPMADITKDAKFQDNTYEAKDVCQPCMRYLARIIANGIEYLGNPDRIK